MWASTSMILTTLFRSRATSLPEVFRDDNGLADLWRGHFFKKKKLNNLPYIKAFFQFFIACRLTKI
jgi:hypothetical protein